jgi:multidrug efflux pump subunit AcrB
MNIWQRIGLFFYDKKYKTFTLWVVVVLFGALSYTTFMRKEGFPSVDVPLGVVQVVSFNRSADDLDRTFSLPLITKIKQDAKVKDIATATTDKGASIQITYERGTDVAKSLDELKVRVGSELPSDAQVIYVKVDASKFTKEGDDILVSVHSDTLDTQSLDEAAKKLEPILKAKVPLAEAIHVFPSTESVTDPQTGLISSGQVRFDRFYSKESGKVVPSVAVGVAGTKGVDQLALYDQVSDALVTDEAKAIGASSRIAVDFAEGIREQVSGLQRNLLEGLIAVLLVSLVLISLRASLVTALSMTTTVAITIGVLNIIGYSINTITLFSLVLCLALIVDDTTIVVEAIDAGLSSGKKFRTVVAEALRKVVRASATGTFTTILAFAPMLFIGGVLGEFIRAIPVTIIISLLVSLVVSFVFIPLFMYVSYARRTVQKQRRESFVSRAEHRFGNLLGNTVIWSTKTKFRSYSTKLHAVFFVGIFVVLGMLILRTVEFNIFPAPKDGKDIVLQATVKDRESAKIEKTEKASDELLGDIKNLVGNDLVEITLLSQTKADREGFRAAITLTDIKDREITSVEIAKKLQSELSPNYPGLIIKAAAAGVGPPEGNFTVQIRIGEKQVEAEQLADDIRGFLETHVLTRVDGTTAKLIDVVVSPSTVITREDDERVLAVSGGFDAKDVSALVALAKSDVQKEFNSERISSYGLSPDTLKFDFGQEEENQKSFASMGKAAGPLFIAMIVLMTFLFRSVLQALLILTALPFALFGVASGLSLTNNPLSFFVMLGVFALIGISVNNAILLTDYANQARGEGASPAEAIAQALRARLRPLLTTSSTSILALLPLALNDPFWEGIAYTLIYGLLSSTLLVIFVFPYFFLIEEALRSRLRSIFRMKRV